MKEDLVGCSEWCDGADAIVPEPVTVIADLTDVDGARELVAYHAVHDDLEQRKRLSRRISRVDVDCNDEGLIVSNSVKLRARVRGALDAVGNVSRGRGAEHVEGVNRTRTCKVVEAKSCRLLALGRGNDAGIARALWAERVSRYRTGHREYHGAPAAGHCQEHDSCDHQDTELGYSHRLPLSARVRNLVVNSRWPLRRASFMPIFRTVVIPGTYLPRPLPARPG